MNKKLFILMFGILILFSFVSVSAVPPVTTVEEFPNGYVIVEIQHQYLTVGENFNYFFFLYNQSNGKTINDSDVNCTFYMTDSESNLLIFGDTVQQPNGYWYYNISGGNFSEVGYYYYGVKCQNEYGGALSGTFVVNKVGRELTTPISILNLGFMGIILIAFIISLFTMFILPNKEERDDEGKIISRGWLNYAKPVLFIVAWCFLMGMFFFSSTVALNYLNFDTFGKFLFNFFKIMLKLTLPMIFIWIIWIFVSIFQDKETKRMIERGGDDFGDI